MLKKKLHNCSINLTRTFLRSSTSTSHNHNSSISNRYHSSISSFTGRIKGESVPFHRGLFSGNPRIDVTNIKGICDFPKKEYLFSSQPEGNGKSQSQCWNCGAGGSNASPLLFCEACRSVQPVDHSVDYFQIFGLTREYDINVDELEGMYKDWQKKLHPDLVHSKSQREKEYAAEQSSRVIDAYRTLCDPLARAIYMLNLQGVPRDEEERMTDPELLSEMMDLRESVEEADGTEALNQIQTELKEKLQYWSKSFDDAFSSKKYEDALSSIQRMTYYRRADEEIVKKL